MAGTSELSYGGIALDAPTDADRELIARYKFDYVMPFACRPSSSVSLLPNQRRLPLPDFPDQPALAAGRLFYPTHASRFAWYIGTVRQSKLDAIQSQLTGNQPVSLPFVMRADDITHTDNAGGITTNLFMLPPRPLGVTSSTLPREPLYLLTLVDERYLWTFQSIPKLHNDELETWDMFLTTVTQTLGISVGTGGAFEDVYLSPETDSDLYSNYEAAPQLLDAIGWNTGRTFVRYFDGSYAYVKTSDAAAFQTANRPSSPRYRAFGGDIYDPQEKGSVQPWINAALPQSVTVTFPKYNNTDGYYIDPERDGFFIKDSYGDVQAVTVALTDLGEPYTQYVGFAANKTIQDTCKALFDADTDADPTNLTTLQDLATQLAKDYYNYQLVALDEAYNGIRDWFPEPLNDLVVDFQPPNLVQTRVTRKPWDFQVWQTQHHVDYTPEQTVVVHLPTNICPLKA
jgi:hypothetical protein